MKNETTGRISAGAPFSKNVTTPLRKTFYAILIVLVFLMLILPVFTTFNEVLTKCVESSGLYNLLSEHVVPFETRLVSLILQLFGIHSIPTDTSLFINADTGITEVYLSWNCLGWQSGILLLITLFVGLTGNHKFFSKFETIIFGISGTFLINILRMSFVAIIAHKYGELPAVLVHDYLGSIFTIVWFLFFWWFSYKFILYETNKIEYGV